MIELTETDADRIASCLRDHLKDVESQNEFTEKVLENIYQNKANPYSFGGNSQESELYRAFGKAYIEQAKAREAKIAELIALLMTGSE